MINYFSGLSFSALSLVTVLLTSTAQATALYSTDTHASKNAEGLDLRWGQTEDNNVQLFDEAQNIHVSNNQLQVDYLSGVNLYEGETFRGGHSASTSLSLMKGNYNSHLIHFDPVGVSTGHIFNTAISFDEEIIAIILSGKFLKSSDSLLGGIDTKYLRNNSSGLEHHDFLTFESSRTLLIDRLWVGRYWIDDARIITQSVPEPSSIALLGLGVIALFGARSFASRENKKHR